jgi:hypothetical protein
MFSSIANRSHYSSVTNMIIYSSTYSRAQNSSFHWHTRNRFLFSKTHYSKRTSTLWQPNLHNISSFPKSTENNTLGKDPSYLFLKNCNKPVNRDWMTGGPSSNPDKVNNFHFSMTSRQVLGPTQPSIQRVQGAHSRRVNRTGREANHSSPTPYNPIGLYGLLLDSAQFTYFYLLAANRVQFPNQILR